MQKEIQYSNLWNLVLEFIFDGGDLVLERISDGGDLVVVLELIIDEGDTLSRPRFLDTLESEDT